jgi:tetratricopeptide (TPR) repeat protein
VIGTPAFMSPEQAAGRWDLLGPASDVYGLGATLYMLLTGRSPFDGSQVEQVLDKVKRGQFLPPRQWKKGLPPALEAICLKAMALMPEQRYASPLELAADLEHWLADEPVRAYRESVPARVARWARRHRLLMGSGIAMLVTAVVALAGGFVVVRQEQQRTEDKRREAVAAQQLAVKSLKEVVLDFQEKLADIPAAHEVRQTLLQRALERLQEVGRTVETYAPAERTTMVAHAEIADIFLNAGGPAAPSGSQASGTAKPMRWTEEAHWHYQRALAIAQALAAADPSNPKPQRDLMVMHLRLGGVYLRLGEPTVALETYGNALAIVQGLATALPQNAQLQRDLAMAYDFVGDINLNSFRNREAAREAYRQSMTVREALAVADPESVEAQRNLAVSLNRLGNVLIDSGDMKAAHEACRRVVDITAKLAKESPRSVQARRDLAKAHETLSDVLCRLGDANGACESGCRAMETRQALAKEDPKKAVLQRDLWFSYRNLAGVHLRVGDYAAARDLALRAVEITTASAADRSNVLAQAELAESHIQLADCFKDAFQFVEAESSYQHGLTILDALEQEGKLQGQPHYAQLRQRTEQSRAVCQAADRAIEDLDYALSQPPAIVSELLCWRMGALAQRGRHAEAVATADHLVRLEPGNPESYYHAACGYAQSVLAVAVARKPEPLSPADQALQEKYSAQAVALFREAVRRGYADLGSVRRHRYLDPLRSREDFQNMLGALEDSSRQQD